MRGGLSKLVLLVIVGLAIATSGALAYWSADGRGTGSGSAATLTKPVVDVPDAPVSGNVDVSWSASTLSNSAGNSQIRYTVERSANGGSTWSAACGGGTINGTGCSDAVGTSGNYVYRVTARLSSSWAELSATSDAVGRRPDRPNVQRATGAATIATVEGTAEAGSAVKLYTNPGCTTAAVDALGNAATGTATGGSFSIQASVPPGESKTFYATSTANSLTSECSTTSASYAALNVAPAAPSNVAATALAAPQEGTDNLGNIDVSWTAVAGATSYQVYRSETLTGGTLVTTVPQPVAGAGSTVTFNDNVSWAANGYYYFVRAVNAVGQSADSNRAGPATPRMRAPALGTVEVVSKQGANTGLKLQWAMPAKPGAIANRDVRYHVYRSTSSTSGFTKLTTGPCSSAELGTATTCTDVPPAAGTYWYRVTAYVNGSAASESAQGNALSGTF